jgi:hypothetical protein
MVMNDKDPFIIEDLDDFHLVIKADEEYRVRSELEAEVRPLLCFLFPRKLSLRLLPAREEYVQLGVDSG